MEPNGYFDAFFMELNELKILLESPEQLKIVIEKLRLDANQPEEIKGFIFLYDALNGDVIKIKEYITNTETSIKNALHKKNKTFSILNYAAGIIVMLGIASFLYFNFKQNKAISSAKAISKNLFVDPGIPIYMSQDTKINWGELMFAIKNESHDKAIRIWQKIEKSAQKNDTVLYYGGIVFRNNNQHKKAIHYFKENLKKESVYNENSLYFLAIYAWERGNKTHAEKSFLKLKNANNLDIRQAAILHIKEFNKFK